MSAQAGWPFLDVAPRPFCCSPMDFIITQRAGASTLASMTTPEGVDVCPRSEDLGRVVGERLLASSWGQRHFFFDLDEVDADFEGACLRLKSRLNP